MITSLTRQQLRNYCDLLHPVQYNGLRTCMRLQQMQVERAI